MCRVRIQSIYSIGCSIIMRKCNTDPLMKVLNCAKLTLMALQELAIFDCEADLIRGTLVYGFQSAIRIRYGLSLLVGRMVCSQNPDGRGILRFWL